MECVYFAIKNPLATTTTRPKPQQQFVEQGMDTHFFLPGKTKCRQSNYLFTPWNEVCHASSQSNIHSGALNQSISQEQHMSPQHTCSAPRTLSLLCNPVSRYRFLLKRVVNSDDKSCVGEAQAAEWVSLVERLKIWSGEGEYI